jgi:hypothetical protein
MPWNMSKGTKTEVSSLGLHVLHSVFVPFHAFDRALYPLN